jgi:hypothetical protein
MLRRFSLASNLEGRGMVCTSTEKAERIAGGFVLIPAAGLLHAWRVCQTKPLRTADFRTWLAAHEMVARRCAANRDRSPTYIFAELAKLLDVAERRARASVKRLVGAGLIDWSEVAIGFPEPAALAQPLDAIGGGRGHLFIPRRILRYLIDGARPALIATVIGLLLRCLSRRKDGFDGRGRVKASWVARVFGISTRQVQAARRQLVDLGWIQPEEGDQWALNRWGRVFRIDLDWVAPRPDGGPESSYPRPAPGPISSHLCLHQDPLPGGISHQDPGAAGASGARLEGKGDQPEDLPSGWLPRATSPVAAPLASPAAPARPTQPAPAPAAPRAKPAAPAPNPKASSVGPPFPAATATSAPRATTSPAPLPAKEPPPTLADVKPIDLAEVGRAIELHRQAGLRGWADASENGLLLFLALVEHVRSFGARSPGALLISLLQRGAWAFATAAEEDAARRRLKAFLRPEPVREAPTLRPVVGVGATGRGGVKTSTDTKTDASIVKYCREASIRAGVFRDPFPILRDRYGWDRPRYEAALAELGLG